LTAPCSADAGSSETSLSVYESFISHATPNGKRQTANGIKPDNARCGWLGLCSASDFGSDFGLRFNIQHPTTNIQHPTFSSASASFGLGFSRGIGLAWSFGPSYDMSCWYWYVIVIVT